jgi:hypothetical protein
MKENIGFIIMLPAELKEELKAKDEASSTVGYLMKLYVEDKVNGESIQTENRKMDDQLLVLGHAHLWKEFVDKCLNESKDPKKLIVDLISSYVKGVLRTVLGIPV